MMMIRACPSFAAVIPDPHHRQPASAGTVDAGGITQYVKKLAENRCDLVSACCVRPAVSTTILGSTCGNIDSLHRHGPSSKGVAGA